MNKLITYGKNNRKLIEKVALLNIALGFLLNLWAYRKLRPLLAKSRMILEANKKYPEFARLDADQIRPLYNLIMAPFVLLKFIAGWGTLAVLCVTFHIVMFFHKRGEPIKEGTWTHWWIKNSVKWVARLAMSLMGIHGIKQKQVAVDYSEYLGPEWKMSYKNTGTIICNHTVFVDIAVHMTRQLPSHVSKAAVENFPVIGSMASAVACLYINRAEKDSRKDMFTQIAERQELSEKGIYPPLIIYPEGGTSNGTHLLKFKQGAFAGLRSVQPLIIKYGQTNNKMDNECCGYNFLAHSVMMFSCLYSSCTTLELPVFTPNEYFWKHHQKKGEEKWETYARVVRDIMAKAGDFKLSDKSIEDKFKFKDLVYPAKAGQHHE